MAVYGVNYQKYLNTMDVSKEVELIQAGQWGGPVRCAYDFYEASGLSSGSEIYMGLIPTGATLLGVIVSYDSLSSDGVLSLADSAGNTLSGDIDASSAGSMLVAGADTVGITYNDEAFIKVTYSSANSATATGTIKVVVLYGLS